MRLKRNTPSPRSHKAKARRQRSLGQKILFFSEIAFVIIFIGATSLLWHFGVLPSYLTKSKEAFYKTTASMGLTLKHVYAEGYHYLEADEIVSIIDLNIGMPLLAIDLKAVKERIEEHHWVNSVIVERQYPRTLHIHITERSPMAIWQHDKQLYLLDQSGRTIEHVNPKEFSHLMLLVGDDAHDYASQLFSMLASGPNIAADIKAAIRVSQRRWNLRLANGIEIKLPENNPEKAWNYLVKLQQENKLLQQNITGVDLRTPGKLYIRKQPNA